MIPATVIPSYLLIAFLLSRPIYGLNRARSIAANRRRWGSLYRDDDLDYWNIADRPLVIFGSVLLSLLWPLIIPGYAAYRYMAGTKIRSDFEKEQDRRRIAELEKELGL